MENTLFPHYHFYIFLRLLLPLQVKVLFREKAVVSALN